VDVIIPGGTGSEPGPRDVRMRTSPESPAEAALAMAAWKRRAAELNAERDELIRTARKLGVNVRQIALSMGISRPTVYTALGGEP
jgi:transcriptional regulator of acetoin/glycerol metabolism